LDPKRPILVDARDSHAVQTLRPSIQHGLSPEEPRFAQPARATEALALFSRQLIPLVDDRAVVLS